MGNILKTAFFAVVALAALSPVNAKVSGARHQSPSKITMICNNGHDYLVEYDTRANRMILNRDTTAARYHVTNVDRAKGWFIVSGTTLNDGPRFQAFFVPQKTMRYFSEDFEQTDRCR